MKDSVVLNIFFSGLKTTNGASNSQTATCVFMVNSAHEPWALEVQLFKRLPEDELPSLAPACEVKDYLPGPTDP